MRGELAGRTSRIVADGRTFAYELQSEPVRLRITQNDVRAIQLAKAALRAGIDLLIEHAGVAEVQDIRLAGAFGAHIDPLRALVLGLVPDAPVSGCARWATPPAPARRGCCCRGPSAARSSG